MRIAAFAHHGGGRKDEKLERCCAAFVGECARLGHSADGASDLDRPPRKLTGYDYVAVFARPTGFFGTKIDRALRDRLKEAGFLEGKKSCAVLVARGPFKERAARELMKVMEAEGMLLTYSDYVAVAQEAPLVARKLFEGD